MFGIVAYVAAIGAMFRSMLSLPVPDQSDFARALRICAQCGECGPAQAACQRRPGPEGEITRVDADGHALAA